MANEVDPAFEELLDYVRDNRGFDFTGYKRASLTRRVAKRMQEVRIEGFTAYQDYLEVHPEEFTHLFNTILINVTSFFRDATAWEFLAAEVVPQIVRRKEPRDAIRIWSAGCASGEEAYTLAMLLAEAVGPSRISERVKIYATDVDENALAQARAGVYSAKAIEPIAPALRERYLEPANGDFAFRTDLRRAVIFGRHDLVNDAPISRVDLIACRNTLMYLNAEAQTKIYNGFHFALGPTGYLFLGRSEMLLTRTNIFQPVDLRRRVFSRVPRAADIDPHTRHAREPLDAIAHDRLRTAAFESAIIAQVVLDRNDALVAVNSRARSEFGLAESDLGRPFKDLELSFRPTELRSRIDRAYSERRPNLESGVTWTTNAGDQRYLDVEVLPLFVDGERLGASITFADVTRPHALQAEVERSRRELETAYEEIQSTVEELETTNEELQSTNEELETTNEELQSTNEELETMNEELQSTNEELGTLNAELGERTGQLIQANVFLESILGSVRAGVVVLNVDLNVESWNARAEDMWGLRKHEVESKNFFALDIGLPVAELRQPIRQCLSGETDFIETVFDATNRRGQPIRCKVICSPMRDQQQNHHGVILLMEPEPVEA